MRALICGDREEAKEAARAAAWKEPTYTCGHSDCPHPEHEGEGRRLIHCSAGGFGANWDLDGVLAAIDAADEIHWVPDSLFDHDLRVRVDGRWRAFEVPAPASVKARTV